MRPDKDPSPRGQHPPAEPIPPDRRSSYPSSEPPGPEGLGRADPPSSEAFAVNTFRDGLGLAMELADDYAFVNAGVLLEATGAVHDIVLAEGIGRTIEPVTCWLVESAGFWPSSSSVLLLSIRPFEVDLIREQDLRLYRNAGWAIAAAGGHLVDWIETDGDLFRSYAYVTCPGAAWVDDQAEDRLSDGSP